MKLLKLLFVCLLFSASIEARPFDHSHSVFNQILTKHVHKKEKQTLVNYKALKEQKNLTNLKKYLDSLTSVTKNQYSTFSTEQRLAFLINAYNAFTLKLIVDNYPIKSIKDIGGFFSSPWKKKFFSLLEEKMHLDGIEHDIIRKDFNEPRIHFAVNCASIGCPSLYPEAFTTEKLEAQLAQAAENFLTNPQKNRIDQKEKTIFLSKIFKWYGKDFEKHGKGVLKFVAPIITSDSNQKNEIISGSFEIDYLDYDWGLNEFK